MDTFTAIESRRSVKHYDSHHEMPEDDFRKMMSLAILSPTSFNIQHWRFVNIVDKELRQKVREAGWNQAQITDASVLLAVCGDIKAWAKEPGRYWRTAPEKSRNFLLPAIENFYKGREQVQRDEAVRSCGIAAQTIMLTAKSMGYDSSPMIGFDSEAVAKLINLPDNHVIAMLLAIGKSIKEAKPRGGQLALDEVVLIDSF